MLTPQFLKNMTRGSDGYIPASDVINREALENFLTHVAEQNPEAGEDYVTNVLEFFDLLQVQFPGPEDRTEDIENRDDIPNVKGIEDFQKKIEEEWDDFEEEIVDTLLENDEKEFPIIIDLFRTGNILVGLKVSNKQENLEETMDIYVETERYEKAAEVRDELKRIGSDKVKQ